jgi:O-methyltransferase/aklanonic acid methyltransferase
MKPVAEDSKARIAALYDGAAATYNRVGPGFFLHFGKRLASLARIAPGSSVLDVATGTGAVLIPSAELAGAGGRVVGVDISPRMIGRARTEIRQAGLGNAEVLVADGERLPFPQKSFDLVLCSFAIFLFPNLHRLISECQRVLRPSGRIGLAYSAGEDKEWRWYEELISRYKPTASLGTERYSPQVVEATLNDCGFTTVATHVEVHRLVFEDAGELWSWSWSHGDRAVLESLTGSSSEFRRELTEEFAKRSTPTGLRYQVSAALTLGAKCDAGRSGRGRAISW